MADTCCNYVEKSWGLRPNFLATPIWIFRSTRNALWEHCEFCCVCLCTCVFSLAKIVISVTSKFITDVDSMKVLIRCWDSRTPNLDSMDQHSLAFNCETKKSMCLILVLWRIWSISKCLIIFQGEFSLNIFYFIHEKGLGRANCYLKPSPNYSHTCTHTQKVTVISDIYNMSWLSHQELILIRNIDSNSSTLHANLWNRWLGVKPFRISNKFMHGLHYWNITFVINISITKQ